MGNSGSSTTLNNCIALNTKITATKTGTNYCNRVMGLVQGSPTYGNNYASSTMQVTKGGTTTTPSSTNPASIQGANITAAEPRKEPDPMEPPEDNDEKVPDPNDLA